MEIKCPSLAYSRNTLDFGIGFYLTSDQKQAEQWAIHVTKRRGTGNPLISVFEIDEQSMHTLRIMRFKCPGQEWLRTVVAYRTNQQTTEIHDIIVGPIADDRTINVINEYLAGTYSESIAIQLLQPMQLKDQWAFKTETALQMLRWKEVITL